MENRIVSNLLCFAFVAALAGSTVVPAQVVVIKPGGAKSARPGNAGKSGGAPSTSPQEPGDADAPMPGGPVFGEVTAVRGTVLQLRTMDGKGLTRVILGSDAKIVKDEKISPDVLKPGTKVTGTGRQLEGTGTPTMPLKVEVHTLEPTGGMGNPFMALFGGGSGPLLRGQEEQVFRKVNYSGNIEFDAVVKSINPLVLTDPHGGALSIVLADDLEVHQRAPRPVRDGDITAGTRLISMGTRTPDGLLKANMVIVLGVGSDRGSMPGTIMAVGPKGVTLRPRFQPHDLLIEIVPDTKVYDQEALDLDAIQVGDTLIFTGKVLGGTAVAPNALVVRTITPAEGETPKLDEGQGGFFGNDRSVTASVKGRVAGFDPLRVQMADGHEVIMTVPGQVSYVRYRLLDRGVLKAGQKALFSGRNKANGLLADLIILNPSPAAGPGF